MGTRTGVGSSMTSLAKSRPTSCSLHNLNQQQQYQLRSMTPTVSRLRRDSAASTASSATCLSSIGRSDGVSLCYPNVEYRENKCFELRKKSALLNKIVLKNQLINDPIFTRANPVHQQIALDQQQQFLNDETINFLMGSNNSPADTSTANSARRRLFVKKNERNGGMFDPNASTASSTTSSSTTATTHNSAFSAFRYPQQGSLYFSILFLTLILSYIEICYI